MSSLPDLSAIRAAQKLLAQYFEPTPLVRSSSLSHSAAEALLKLETRLPTGSFKPRGAVYALAINVQRRHIDEVTASSTGNHGAAVAFAAKLLGLKATIFLPQNPNPVKRKKIEDLGGHVICAGSTDLAGAFQAAQSYSKRDGVYFLNDATDPDLPAGPGTIGLEILDQCSDVTSVFVPMGDTALIRGVGGAVKPLKPSVRVIGVQAEQAPSYVLSWREGKPVPTDTCDTCADGLATRTPEAENVDAIRKVVDDVILVTEDRMIDAIRHLHVHDGVLAEPAGAAATAAWLDHPRAGRSVLLVTGSNITDEVRRMAGV